MGRLDMAEMVTLDDTLLGDRPPGRIMSAIEKQFAALDPVSVLDVGCGDTCRVRLSIPTRTVGIDASATHIGRNVALDERIVGDIDATDFGVETYDLVVCWNVLEHLRSPMGTVDRMIAALRPGGMLLLAWPNFVSVKAALARRLPHSAHETVFRWIYPYARGNPDNTPFPTVLDDSLRLDRVLSHVVDRGVVPIEVVKYESSMQRLAREKVRLNGLAWRFAKGSVNFVTGGRLDLQCSDVMALLSRSDQGTAPKGAPS